MKQSVAVMEAFLFVIDCPMESKARVFVQYVSPLFE